MTGITVSPEARSAFTKLARGNGQAIEEVIVEVYRALSSGWSEPLVVIDGGAHMGYHTTRMADIDKISKVVAIEANPKTYEHHYRANAHAPHAAKVCLINAALQDRDDAETVSFTTSVSHPGRSGINPIMALYDKKTTFEQPITVTATTIDKLTAEHGKCGFIKLDLEGSEYAALRGGRSTLSRDAPVCVLENGPDAPAHGSYAINDFIAYMQSVGMTLVTVFGDELTAQNAPDFWYAWAIPTIRLDETRGIIIEKLLARIP